MVESTPKEVPHYMDERPLLSRTQEVERPHLFGQKPQTIRNQPFIPPSISFERLGYINFANILWTILVGWWLSLSICVLGLLLVVTLFGFKLGLRCFNLAKYVLYPFGYYAYLDDTPTPNIVGKLLFYVFSIIVFIPLLMATFLSWELIFYIPMAKFLWKLCTVMYSSIHRLRFARLKHHNPKSGRLPAMLTHSAGSFFYFKFTIFNMEVIYLNLLPLVALTFYLGYFAHEESPLREAVTGTLISILATIPCMYVIGVCTEIISGRCGLVLGSLINAGSTGLVELILFYFSIRKGLGDVVRAAVTGAFLMNLLVIPGLSMLAAGIKWKEVKLNRKVQSVSGTFLFLAIVAVFFPAVFYNIYKKSDIVCSYCDGKNGVFHVKSTTGLNCTMCSLTTPDDITKDHVYSSMAKPLMYTTSILMPIVYGVGLFFSLHTHKYIYDQFEAEQEAEENQAYLNTYVCVIIIVISCIVFSIVCEVLTDIMPKAIDKLNLTERFVGLVFYTIVPAIAEFMNAIRFALEGNMGLSLEVGNQGAMVVSLIQMPALVLISAILGSDNAKNSFTLMFEMIDVFAIIISVLLRNSMLTEKSINYFTGFAFLIIFLLIAVVYYFDPY